MNFASLYSGCGGFDLGFISEGFNSVAAYDLDPAACLNFKSNVGEHVFNVDLINGIPNKQELDGIDVLIAGPPCQGFSTAGKRDVNDKRNHLLTHTGKLAIQVAPKVLVVENVPGALSGDHARYWDELTNLMQSVGYHTQTIKCQTSELGMAQERKRILFFAWKTKQHFDISLPTKEPENLRAALAGVRGLPNHNPKRLIRNSKEWLIAKKINPGQKLSNVRGGCNSVATWDIPSVYGEITEDERTILELIRRLRRQERVRKYGDADPVAFSRLENALGPQFMGHINQLLEKGYLRKKSHGVDLVGTFNGKYRRLEWDGPSCTVDTRFGSPRYFLHPSYERGFTIREAARLQGFEDDYIFKGSEQAQYRVIGNAVPPPLGALAAKISKQLLGLN
jgi:DNA (cytosine-5)-methyltransferase 1